MMGFGFLMMLLVIGVPLVAIVVLAVWLANRSKKQTDGVDSYEQKICKDQKKFSQRTARHCLFLGIGLGFVSYVVARIALDGYPHPYHWLSALTGGIAGIPLGWLWYAGTGMCSKECVK